MGRRLEDVVVRPRERLRIVNFTSGGDVLLFSRRVQDVISLDLMASRGREICAQLFFTNQGKTSKS